MAHEYRTILSALDTDPDEDNRLYSHLPSKQGVFQSLIALAVGSNDTKEKRMKSMSILNESRNQPAGVL